MAGVTGLVNSRSDHQAFGSRAMGIMTLGAGHLPKANRMYRGHKKLLALFLVTFETDIRLGLIRKHRVTGSMNSVATGTGYVSVFMTTAFPVDMLIIMMAGQAHAVLLLDWFIRLETKIQYWRSLLSRPDFANMAPLIQGLLHRRRTGHTRAVAGFTLQLGKGRTFIALLSMFGFENIEDRIICIFIMTFDTGVGAFICEDSLLHIFHGGRRAGYGGWRGWLLLLFLRPVCQTPCKATQENQ